MSIQSRAAIEDPVAGDAEEDVDEVDPGEPPAGRVMAVVDEPDTGDEDAGAEGGKGRRPRRQWSLAARLIPGLAASVLLVLAMGMPVWAAKLKAPQYPKGLTIEAYSDRMVGDISEVDELNHYVGMKPFRFDGVPEVKLWIPSLVAALLALVVATLLGRRLLGRLARLYIWLLPVGVLADIQFRLYQYGHDLAPNTERALRLDPFTPLVVGPTKVWNFKVFAYPGRALIFIAISAALLSLGPLLIDKAAAKLRSEQ